MAGPIRNSCVARGLVTAAGLTAIYTVPATTVLLLKDIRLVNNAAGATIIDLYLLASDGSAYLDVSTSDIAVNGYASWSGWIAMNAGDILRLNTTAAPCGYWVSGALLPYVPGF